MASMREKCTLADLCVAIASVSLKTLENVTGKASTDFPLIFCVLLNLRRECLINNIIRDEEAIYNGII